jgi:hypothetical protein
MWLHPGISVVAQFIAPALPDPSHVWEKHWRNELRDYGCSEAICNLDL